MDKIIVYQVLPRLFGNFQDKLTPHGTIAENGCGKFKHFSPTALKQIRELGATHVWYTGVIEHATQTDYSAFGIRPEHAAVVKGRAGSPYAIKDYYDVDPDLAVDVNRRMEEFEALVARTHRARMKVIIDFVPNHVAREYASDMKPAGVADLGEGDNTEWAFSPQNNFYYLPGQQFAPDFDVADYVEMPARATGNDQFTAHPGRNDWYETVKLNYGVDYVGGGQRCFEPRPNTWDKMLHILLYWAAKGVDGFRCDMAEMVPVEFWGWAIPEVKARYPEVIFVAEVYNPQEYRNYIYNGRFDYLYDKVGLYDRLRDVTSRNTPVQEITQSWQAVQDIADHMLNFLENHDEQRVASGFYSGQGVCAQPAMIVAATLGRGPVMVYMGQELGELGMDSEGFSGVDGRTTIFDYWSVKSIRSWANGGKWDGAGLSAEQYELREFYKRLLNVARTERAVTEGMMYDLEYANLDNPDFNAHEQFAYFRHVDNEVLLVVLNFDDRPKRMKVRIPQEAFAHVGLTPAVKYGFVDLLDDDVKIAPQVLSAEQPFEVELGRWKGGIYRLVV